MFPVGRILVAILLFEQNIAMTFFREYEQSVGARYTQSARYLHGLSAAGKLRCAVVCLATVNCHSFNYYHHDDNDISTSSTLDHNCELLTMTWQEAANDDNALTADDDWSFYGSQPLVISGRRWAFVFLAPGGAHAGESGNKCGGNKINTGFIVH